MLQFCQHLGGVGIALGACIAAVHLGGYMVRSAPEAIHSLTNDFTDTSGLEISGRDVREFVPEYYRDNGQQRAAVRYVEKLARNSGASIDSSQSRWLISKTHSFARPLADNHPLLSEFDYDYPNVMQKRAHEAIDRGFQFPAQDQDRKQGLKDVFHVVEGLQYINRNKDELNFINDLLANYKPDKAFEDWQDALIKECIASLRADPYVARNISAWVKPTQYESLQHAGEQYILRAELCQYLSDNIRKKFGLEPIPVHILPLPDNLYFGGFYHSDDDYIVINYSDKFDVVDRPNISFFETIFEEIKHSVDAGLAEQCMKQEMAPDDVRYEHAAMIWLNGAHYCAVKTHMIGPVSVWQSGVPEYYSQYLEDNAKEFAKEMSQGIKPIKIAQKRVPQP